MIRGILVATTVLSTVVAGATMAAPARADDQQYIADIQAHGLPMLAGPGAALGKGYEICTQIRNGMSAAAAANQWGIYNTWGPIVVAAAQHDLCPDTL